MKGFVLGVVVGTVVAGYLALATNVLAPVARLAGTGTGPIPTFQRDEYLSEWADADGDCQDTRTEMLVGYGSDVVLSADKCTVLSGEWRDEFSGAVIDDPDDVEIRHAVSLEEAHVSGAHAWNEDEKRAFANDFALPDGSLRLVPQTPLISNLIITSAASAAAESSLDPAGWLPENAAARCRHVQRWAVVKARWNLVMDEGERAALAEALTHCPWDWDVEGSVAPSPVPDLAPLTPPEQN